MFHDIYVLLDDGDRQVLRAFNLSPSQFAVLLLLDGEAGWRLTDLSERLLVDKSTITRIVDRLESAGLVRREADPDDRRVQRVVLTGEGQQTRDRARAAHELSIERRMGALDADEQRELLRLLTRLRDGLQADLVTMGGAPSE
ncbi:MAG: MarR family transcriptional regulator [Chloroflexaceae bacterium]|nr:MarR family transcriptional regulator [Chloroflexaceae bacterium]